MRRLWDLHRRILVELGIETKLWRGVLFNNVIDSYNRLENVVKLGSIMLARKS